MLALLILLAARLGLAQRVLFVETQEGYELTAAQTLGYGSKKPVTLSDYRKTNLSVATIITRTEWYSMTTADFASYDAIILSDPFFGLPSLLQYLEDTKPVWSPAVTGNMIDYTRC